MYRTNFHTHTKQQAKLQDTQDYKFPAHAGHVNLAYSYHAEEHNLWDALQYN